mgnify:CR=1 FL=1
MENASKALIIAGAILLAILLISLGIMIFTQAQSTVNNSGMSQAEITSFNSQFSKYENDKIKGSMVKSLIQEVNTNNAQDESQEHQIDLTAASNSGITLGESNGSYTTSGIVNTQTYSVKITGYASDGRINAIEIGK